MSLLAAFLAGLAAAAAVAIIAPAPARLADRLGPYLAPVAARLRVAIPPPRRPWYPELFKAIVDRRQGRPPLDRRLSESGLWSELSPGERAARYRARVTAAAAGGGALAASVGAMLGATAAVVLIMLVLGSVGGATSVRAHVDRSTRARRQRIRLELPTICQLLAVWVRSGGGVVSACSRLVGRARGEVVAEVDRALRLHRTGTSVEEAFSRVATTTPERFAARLYLLLGGADHRGHDVAAGLLALADQLRGHSREEMRREATRRRATMLLPIIGLLGPTLVLFVAAPLPWIVLRSL